jgi:hypothetical protein
MLVRFRKYGYMPRLLFAVVLEGFLKLMNPTMVKSQRLDSNCEIVQRVSVL